MIKIRFLYAFAFFNYEVIEVNNMYIIYCIIHILVYNIFIYIYIYGGKIFVSARFIAIELHIKALANK